MERLFSAVPGRNALIIAHRGFSAEYPPNTIPAINAAIALGVDYVEVDLNLSKDDEVIVIHDGTVDQTTDGRGRVRDLTLKQLKALDSGSWFHDKFAGVRISTLEEIIPLFKNSKTRLCLEIKRDVDGRPYEGIEGKVIDLLKRHGLVDRIVFTSFSKEVLRRVKSLEPCVPTSYDPSAKEYENCSARQLCQLTLSCQSHILSCKHKVIDEAFMRETRLFGVPVWAWSVNDAERIRFLLSIGVEAILTAQPDLLQQVLSESAT